MNNTWRTFASFAVKGLLPLILMTAPAQAVDFTLHGALKNETAYFVSGDKRFDKFQNRLDIKPEAILSDRWEFRGRGLLWYDTGLDFYADNATDLSPGMKLHYRSYTQSKEAYLLYAGDAFDFRIGQQQIVWGKTDGIRMLDIINPLDMREFILDDFLDSRIGLWAVRLNYYADIGGSEHEFELVFIPDARPGKLAPAASRWAFALPATPPGITARFLPASQPNFALKNSEIGAAWRANLGGWDLSLNYFYGWKDSPNLFKNLVGTTLNLQTKHLRMHTAGGSFANAFGAFVVRGEAAVNFGEGINTTALNQAASVRRHTTLNGALAIDYSKSNWTIGVQLFGRHIVDAVQIDHATNFSTNFVTLRIATDYMNEKLKPELLLMADIDEKTLLARPKISYEFSDAVIGRLGMDIFTGSGGFFGQFAANDRIYSELEWSF